MTAVLDIERRIGRYSRELGFDDTLLRDNAIEAYRSALRNHWARVYDAHYRGEVSVDGKRIALVELPPEYMPANVLGMTDCFSTIWLRSDLTDRFGYNIRNRVLEHEKEHVRDPLAPENEVRRRTNTERLLPYSLN